MFVFFVQARLLFIDRNDIVDRLSWKCKAQSRVEPVAKAW